MLFGASNDVVLPETTAQRGEEKYKVAKLLRVEKAYLEELLLPSREAETGS